jgi:hypothetical protein
VPNASTPRADATIRPGISPGVRPSGRGMWVMGREGLTGGSRGRTHRLTSQTKQIAIHKNAGKCDSFSGLNGCNIHIHRGRTHARTHAAITVCTPALPQVAPEWCAEERQPIAHLRRGCHHLVQNSTSVGITACAFGSPRSRGDKYEIVFTYT